MAAKAGSRGWSAMVSIGGQLDPSLENSFLRAARELDALGKAAKASGLVLDHSFDESARHAHEAFGRMAHDSESAAHRAHAAWKESTERIKGLLRPLTGTMGLIGRVSGVGAILGGLGGEMFLSAASKTAAEREQQRVQMQNFLRNQGKEELTDPLIMQLRKYADMASSFRFKPVMDAANALFAAGVKPGEKGEGIMNLIRRLGDLAPNAETLGNVVGAYAQAKSRGFVGEYTMNRLVNTAHVAIWPAMMKALGLKDTDPNRAEVMKRMRKKDIHIQFLDEAIRIMTDPGGIMYQHQKEQLKTFAGQWSSFMDRFGEGGDLQAAVGNIMNRFFYPFIHELNVKLTPQAFEDYFSGIARKAEDFQQKVIAAKNTIIFAFKALGESGELKETQRLLGEIWDNFRDAVGLKGGPETRAQFAGQVLDAFQTLNTWLVFIKENMGLLVHGAETFVMVWGGIKVINTAATLITSIRAIASAFVAMESAAIGAGTAAAAAQGGGAGAAGRAAGIGWLNKLGVFGAVGSILYDISKVNPRAQEQTLLDLGTGADKATEALKGFPSSADGWMQKAGGLFKALDDLGAGIEGVVFRLGSLAAYPFVSVFNPQNMIEAGKGAKPGGGYQSGHGPLEKYRGAKVGTPTEPLLTHYGYAGDPWGDAASGNKPGNYTGVGIGNRDNPLIEGTSAGVSADVAEANRLAKGQWFTARDKITGDLIRRRYDDTPPIPGRVDIYDKQRLFDKLNLHPLEIIPDKPGASRSRRGSHLLNRASKRTASAGGAGGDFHYAPNVTVHVGQGETATSALEQVLRGHADDFYARYKSSEHERGRVSFYPDPEMESDDV